MLGRIWQRKPSPALVIAVIALVVAATGTAIGLPGHDTVDSRDVVNNALKSKDLQDGKAVGRRDLLPSQQTRSALVAGNGTIVQQSGGITLESHSNGQYVLDFGTSVKKREIITSSKFPQAGPIPTANSNGFVEAAICGADPSSLSNTDPDVTCSPDSVNDSKHVFVQTSSADRDITSADDRPFYIAILPK